MSAGIYEETVLKQKIEGVIRDLGMSKQEFYNRYNVPSTYLRRLGNGQGKNKVPPKAIKWFKTFLEKGINTPPYDKEQPNMPKPKTQEPITVKDKKPADKFCPKCGAEGHRDGAMYCYACGSALKTRAEFIVSSLESIRSDIGILPSYNKDRIRDILIMAVDYIKEIS